MTPIVRMKRGTEREDGMVLWAYRSRAGGEIWATKETYAARIEREKARNAALSEEARLRTQVRSRQKMKEHIASVGRRKHGDICPETGRVFWGYIPQCAGGEYWVTPEKIKAWKDKQSLWEKTKASPERKTRYQRISSEARDRLNERARINSKTPENRKKLRDKAVKVRSRNVLSALAYRCRSRLAATLRSRGLRKHKRTAAFIGCSWAELRAHIEKQFLPGMTWENRKLWHLDHRIPIAWAQTDEELYRLCHYTNIQPMWALDNIRKGRKMPENFVMPDTFQP